MEQAAAQATSSTESQPYEAFYGLADSPFSLSTDPKFLYHSTAHDRTAQTLLTSIGTREGIVVITGPFGIGKTALCRAVLEQFDRRTLTSFLVDPFVSVDDLLRTLLIDFGVLSRDDLAAGLRPSTLQLRATLQSFLGSLAPLEASAVVLIDEAQNLPVSVLQELRALADIGGRRRLLHVVLVGEPGLLTRLNHRDLRPVKEQVAVWSVLGPLTADELPGYVAHRLDVSGGRSRVEFDDAAIARIHDLTNGVPRTVNLLCDRAMARGFDASANRIGVTLVDEGAASLGLSAPVAGTPQMLSHLMVGLVLLMLMFLGAAAASWVFRDDVRRMVVQWERVPASPAAPRLPLTQPLQIPQRSGPPVSSESSQIAPRDDNRLAPPAI